MLLSLFAPQSRHSSLDARPSSLGLIADGVEGIRQTAKLMCRIVKQYRADPAINEFALSLIADVAPKNWTGEIGALFAFVRDQIRYTLDPRDVETLRTPDVTLAIGQGDCDDKSILLATLLETTGHPTRFITVGFTDEFTYEHVYVEVKIGDKWIACDATESVALGWAPPNPLAKMCFYV